MRKNLEQLLELDKRHKWEFNNNSDLECKACHKIISSAKEMIWYRTSMLPPISKKTLKKIFEAT